MSAASLPRRTTSYGAPVAAFARTTSAIARATSAGPKAAGSASMWTAAVTPTDSASRSWSTDSAPPRVSTVADPWVASAIWVASSTAHSSCGLIVDPVIVASMPRPSAVMTGSVVACGTRLTHTSTSAIRQAPDPQVLRVEQRRRVVGGHGDRVELLHVRHRELVADDRLVRREEGHEHVLAEEGAEPAVVTYG